MHKIGVSFFLFFCCTGLRAQTDSVEKIFALKITSYQKQLNDSVSLIQVLIPDEWPLSIRNNQLGILNHCYQKDIKLDTALIGWGRCQLIKGNYHYFAIHLYKNQEGRKGDLLYTRMKIRVNYDGLLLNTMKHCINFSSVTDKLFVNSIDIFTINKQDEVSILDSMIADIHYTGSVMQDQIPEQNNVIKGGMYNGKKLFTAMQSAKRTELESFFKYMNARPKNYAGNTWKLSEIFATWMVSETPEIIE